MNDNTNDIFHRIESFFKSKNIEIDFDINNYFTCITGINRNFADKKDTVLFDNAMNLTSCHQQYSDLLKHLGYKGCCHLLIPDESYQLIILFSVNNDPVCIPLDCARKIHELTCRLSNVKEGIITSISGQYSGLYSVNDAYLEARRLNNLSFFELGYEIISNRSINRNQIVYSAPLFQQSLHKLNNLLCSASLAEILKQVDFLSEIIKKSMNYDFFSMSKISIEQTLILFFKVYHVNYTLDRKKQFSNINEYHDYICDLFRYFYEHRSQDLRLSYDVLLAAFYIHNNFEKEITMKSIAEHMNINVSTLSTEFNSQFHCSFNDYLGRIRLEHAAHILKHTQMTIAQTASACGFSSARYFTYSFRKYFDVPPSEYRKREFIQ